MSGTNASGALPRGWWTDWVASDGIRSAIAAGVRAGHSDQEVAIRAGVSSKTVQRYRKRNGIKANAVNQHGPKSGDSQKETP